MYPNTPRAFLHLSAGFAVVGGHVTKKLQGCLQVCLLTACRPNILRVTSKDTHEGSRQLHILHCMSVSSGLHHSQQHVRSVVAMRWLRVRI